MKKNLKPYEEVILILICGIMVFIAAIWFLQIAIIIAIVTLMGFAIYRFRKK